MTWGQFKKAVEAKGVRDDAFLLSIEVDGCFFAEGRFTEPTDIVVRRRDPDDAVTIESW